MILTPRTAAALAFLLLGLVRYAPESVRAQQPAGPVYVLTHIDVTPNFTEATVNLMRSFAADARKDPENSRFEVMRQDSRGNHLIMMEVWSSRQAYEQHTAHEHSKSFREKMQPMLGSPFDVRLHSLF